MNDPAAPAALPLLHADDDLLVLDKPAGLLSVPGRGPDKQDCLSARVQRQHPEALVVHRLDMATSGLIVMARHLQAQRALSRAFEERVVQKRYVAVVDGLLQPCAGEWGVIELPLAVDWPRRPLNIVDHENGKPSTTRWRVIAQDAVTRSTRIELEPLTGRTHQLRVHLQAIGHPILGDALYASPQAQARASRLLLHATHLQLPHPRSGAALAFSSAPPF